MIEGIGIQTDKNTYSNSWVEEYSKGGIISYKKESMSFVKVTNLRYDVWNYNGFGYVGENDKGINVTINGDDLITEWIGVMIHMGDGVTQEGMNEYFGRYCGGIEDLNEDIIIDEPMEVTNLDFEILTDERVIEELPQFKDFLNGKYNNK